MYNNRCILQGPKYPIRLNNNNIESWKFNPRLIAVSTRARKDPPRKIKRYHVEPVNQEGTPILSLRLLLLL